MTRFFVLLRYIIESFRLFVWRLRYKGVRSALIFLRCRTQDFYVSQRNKRIREPQVECPCCGWTGYDFYTMDATKFWLPSVICPNCGGCERHRLLHLYMTRHDPELFSRKGAALHFAPEGPVRNLIKRNPALQYFATDFSRDLLLHYDSMRFRCDIQNLPIKDASFEVVFCLHVLEHVRDDLQAVAELERILAPTGVAYIMVPFDMNLDETVEWEEPDPDIYDHIWAYALPDFKYRLGRFAYEEIKPASILSPDEIRRYRIPDKEVVYRCVRRV